MQTRRTFLRGTSAAAAAGVLSSGLPRGAASGAAPARKRVVTVVALGGWDTSYALDPKEPTFVDTPEGSTRWFDGLDVLTHPSRPGVTALFERHAGVISIVRGLSTDAINHAECMIRMATGTRQSDSPDVAAILAYEAGRDLPVPYLMLGDLAYAGPYAALAARTGLRNQLAALTAPVADPAAEPSAAEQALLERYVRATAARERATRGAHGANARRLADFESSMVRARRLRGLGSLGTVGEAQSLSAQVDLALDALEQDLSQSVTLSTRLDWDTHGNNDAQGQMFDTTFAQLARLLDELARRPGRAAGTKMIDDTVVLCISDLSRTPRKNGGGGKEHWPVIASMVMGAGVRGGKVVGATTPDAQALPVDLLTGAAGVADGNTKALYSHFIAGVVALCGVDPASRFSVPPLLAFHA